LTELLNQVAIDHILDQDNELFLSVASSWEIAIKFSLGKLPLPEPLDTYIPGRLRLLGAKHLDIIFAHACQVCLLPQLHRDGQFDSKSVLDKFEQPLSKISAKNGCIKMELTFSDWNPWDKYRGLVSFEDIVYPF
jgi:hypothetical protein